jgi:aryl-alcohol dehydrogenase-like predicted oxidoreductase
MGFLVEGLTDKTRNAVVGELETVAKELGCTLAQLAIAWCLKNPRVSTVITGASRVEQVKENMKALEVAHRLTGAAMDRIDNIVAGHDD